MIDTMKRILYIAAALLLAACSREVLPEPIPQEENKDVKTRLITLTASFDPETRLTFSSTSGDGYWSSDDEIALFTSNGNLVKGTIKDGDYNITNSRFTFEIAADDAIDENSIAYYPYSIAVAGNPNQIRLPDAFNNATVQFRNVPMKAVVNNTGTDLCFKHLASMVIVSIPNTPSYPGLGKNPKQILFETNQPISGLFSVAGTADAPTLSPVNGETGTSITSAWVAGEKHMYILPAGTYDGFSISIKNNDGFVLYKKNRSSSFTATRAKLVNMPDLDVQDYKGIAFYLTGNETAWSNNTTKARMIQVSKNSFIGAMYSSRGSNGDSDLGFKILPGNQMGDWNYVIGSIQDSNKATYGGSAGNFNASQGVYSVQITFGSNINGNSNPWEYSVNWVSDDNFNHGALYLSGGFGDIPMNNPVMHNWVAEVTVAEGTNFEPNHDYWWKVRTNGWSTEWGRGTINNNQLYSGVELNAHGDEGNGSINLSAGTYDVFFNDAIGRIMFVKK